MAVERCQRCRWWGVEEYPDGAEARTADAARVSNTDARCYGWGKTETVVNVRGPYAVWPRTRAFDRCPHFAPCDETSEATTLLEVQGCHLGRVPCPFYKSEDGTCYQMKADLFFSRTAPPECPLRHGPVLVSLKQEDGE